MNLSEWIYKSTFVHFRENKRYAWRNCYSVFALLVTKTCQCPLPNGGLEAVNNIGHEKNTMIINGRYKWCITQCLERKSYEWDLLPWRRFILTTLVPQGSLQHWFSHNQSLFHLGKVSHGFFILFLYSNYKPWDIQYIRHSFPIFQTTPSKKLKSLEKFSCSG